MQQGGDEAWLQRSKNECSNAHQEHIQYIYLHSVIKYSGLTGLLEKGSVLQM